MFVVMKVYENQADNQENGNEERESFEGSMHEECLCGKGKGALEFLSEELITKMPMEVGRGHLGNVAAHCVPAASLLVLLRLRVDLVWVGVI